MRRRIHAMTLMMLPALVSAAAMAAEPVAPAGAAPAIAAPAPGKVAFDRWCAECHAPGHGHSGTQQLERIRGARLSVLESRPDLEGAYIRLVVRNGQNAMPAYRPSEINDATLDSIAQYLGRKQPPAKPRRQ
jgi:(+)-pinoresinol hydroxylase